MIETTKLPCGVRVVWEEMPQAQAASIGFWVGAGSSLEAPEEAGISHFLEHMLFKGTQKRSAADIARETDRIGAQVNAFTGREATCFHLKALSGVFLQGVDILLDMLCHSLFQPGEIRKEKGVVLEEIKMYEDMPDELVLDLLTASVLRGSGLADAVIGKRTTLGKMNRARLSAYMDRLYTRDNIVVSVVGAFDRSALFEQLETALVQLPARASKEADQPPQGAVRVTSRRRDIAQTHLAIGRQGVPLDSDLYYAQAIVNDVLGGSMSSRLFQKIREERGLAYSVFSAGYSYMRAGIFFIYAGIGIGNERETLAAIGQELEQLAAEGLKEEEVAVVKQRLKSGFIFGQESMNSRMYRQGKNLLLLGRTFSPQEIMEQIDQVTLEEIQGVCLQLGDLTSYSGAVISKEKMNLRSLMF